MLKIFNKSMRCQCNNHVNNKLCRNKQKQFIMIYNKRTCNFHLKYYYSKYAIYIQKIYRGSKSRRLLNNIYKKLSCDIQYIIKYHMNKELYHKKREKVISSIVNFKIYTFLNKMFYYHLFINVNEFLKHKNDILVTFNLYNKYNILIDDYYKSKIKREFNIINNYIIYLQENAIYENAYNKEIEKQKIDLDIILGMVHFYMDKNTNISSSC